ncbi:YHYH protein [Yoonia maricola]|uniref:YHYH protein n=1 Tax=Yoonia maricola TaxID=420999 RepID=A0A2M8W4C2_9RHOB|nr:YHYH protein [Yoonia maricola]PJI85758.1 YHYH protein [Yoonia maricola]
MNRSFITAIVITGCASIAHAQTDDRLSEISGFFASADVISGPEIVDCTLSGGTETSCFSITLGGDPLDYTPGPWCPTNISDGADAGGIWLENGEVYDVDGDFIANLAEFYGDSNWQLFDEETGEVRFTGSLEACEAAARPDVAEEYQNYCVQCLPEYISEDSTLTYVIPLEPVASDRPTETRMSGSGVAYNGVRFDAPAPVDAILSAYTIAAFDDCGGHVNPFVGYHYHAVTDCLENSPAPVENDSLGAPIGIAMDGHLIYPHLLADGSHPTDLDACNGHLNADGSYYYHAGAAGSNAILGCLAAEAGCMLEDEDGVCDASARIPRP